ncbi:MAG: ABC transporter substrate-binding protein [Deltaproteobacteria bacterium]|nr:ABC transporter substrate-binding protein [Deltaproteobacteria bacterium]
MLLALPYPTMSFLPFYAAEDLGFFGREGLSIHCIHVRDEKERKVKLALKADLAFYTSVSTTVEAVLRNWGEVKALCATQLSLHFCTARQEIKALQDLQGRKVMVGGGASNNQILYLCKKLGWEPGRDITIVRGDAAGRIRAFQDPGISAVIAREEYTYWGLKAGFHLLNYPQEYMRWHGGGLCTAARLIAEQPDLVYRTVRAVVRATDVLNRNREEAIALALRRISNLSPEEAEGNYDILLGQGGYACAITEEGIRYMSEVLGLVKGSTKKVTLKDVADLSFLERAERELSAGNTS